MADIATLRTGLAAFTIPQIVNVSNMPRQTVVDFLTGKKDNPTIRTVTRLESALEQLQTENRSKTDEKQTAQAAG